MTAWRKGLLPEYRPMLAEVSLVAEEVAVDEEPKFVPVMARKLEG